MDTNLREKFEQILTQQQMAHNVDSDWLNKLPDLKEFVLDCMSAAKSEGAETIEAETELIQYYEAKLLGKSESLQGVIEVLEAKRSLLQASGHDGKKLLCLNDFIISELTDILTQIKNPK